MSSSDSEDSYYSNAAKKMRLAREQLKKLQNTELEEKKSGEKTKEENSNVNLVNNPLSLLNDSIDDGLIIDEIIAKNSKPPPRTRGRKKKESILPESSITPVANARGRGRGRGRGGKRGRGPKNDVANSNENDISLELLSSGEKRKTNKRGRGRNRGRGRRQNISPNFEDIMDSVLPHFMPSRGPRMQPTRTINISSPVIPSNVNQMYPTYSIGNTDEYPDNSDDIPLFSKPSITKPDEVIVLDEDIPDNLDNESLSVKVTWQCQEIFKFTIRKYQKLTQIFEMFSKKENIDQDKLLFTYNNKILTPNDTPALIDYNIAKFIDGGVVSHSVKAINKAKIVNGIQIKFQCQNVKKPVEITIGSDDRILSAMTECAEHLAVPLNKLKFEFDGDIVAGTNTPRQLGIESGDCIDVKIK